MHKTLHFYLEIQISSLNRRNCSVTLVKFGVWIMQINWQRVCS